MNERKKMSFYTLGCKLNKAETGGIIGRFVENGYEIVPFENSAEADIVYINTCTVTASADSSCRNVIRRARRNSPNSIIVVTGCYAQLSAEKLESMEEIDIILGVEQKEKIFELLLDQKYQEYQNIQNNKCITDISRSKDKDFFLKGLSALEDGTTRAFLKIQDGCNYFCSYCIIPHARGVPRSLPEEQVLHEISKVINSGVKEVVLTGINLGEYNSSNINEPVKVSGLLGLIKKIKETEIRSKLHRLRLSSIEPNKITEELLIVLKDLSCFMDYFHIPLQSGDDVILKKMNRRYSVSEYLEITELIKKYFPDAGIGSDIIVGFPGEVENEFKNTCRVIENSSITHLHIFPYSDRGSISMSSIMSKEKEVKSAIKKERVAILERVANKKLKDFSLSMLGRRVKVLFENKKNISGLYQGYTSNYLRAVMSVNSVNGVNQIRNLSGEIEDVVVREVKGKNLYVY
ncbi:MAG: tRNA (N(6)-L-threonylcarbamoyladenosine(37)-C(2))-methylthiotransferase MtaB [Oligoflexia bacterium]|nr:tRNA (N(6)-L-threonylcarbamoyladenosine(37)-C(2))-methylthiotransferase MtaB [Oligoflexia bacterium]